MNRWMMLALACALASGACGKSETTEPATHEHAHAEGDHTHAEPAAEAAVYECPMHCKLEGQDEPYRQGEPGKCPVCGMDLEKQ